MDVETTSAHRSDEVAATRTIVDRVEDRLDINPERLISDTAYGTFEMLGWMIEEKSIQPHVPVWDKSERKDGSLGRSDFKWDDDADEYRCPQGKALRSTGKPTTDNTLIYRSMVAECTGCPLKSRCCPNATHRKITRERNESAWDVAGQIATTDWYAQSRRHRKKVEMLFAQLKRILRLDRLRLIGAERCPG